MRTITVRRLLELLEGEDMDRKVIFTADYGDYHHTPQALPIEGEFDDVTIVESAYSNSGYAIGEPDEDVDPNTAPDYEPYLVLR